MDNILSTGISTPQDIQRELATRFKARRLTLNLTQEGLAARSGVSWGSLKRFEHTGLIALDSLLKLALVLDCLPDFDNICPDRQNQFEGRSLDSILAEAKPRAKGRLK
jgi:transcriptional regulator with XRE-family HTH domain